MTKLPRRRPARSAIRDRTSTSLIEEVEATPAGAQEMDAARLAHSVSETIRRAMEACGLQQQELAKRLGVTPARVSQVLADGNIRIATLGRFARALGYQARIVFEPVEPGVATPIGRDLRLSLATVQSRSRNLSYRAGSLDAIDVVRHLGNSNKLVYVQPKTRRQSSEPGVPPPAELARKIAL